MQRIGIYEKTPSKKKESEPNEWVSGEYPGEKIQVDVKYVPKKCMSKELQEKGEKFYQYTAIDEYSRLRYTWFTNAHDTYASSEFAKRLVKYFPFKVKTIQTDNGFEFTNRLSWQAFLKNKKTMFEKTLEELGIEYKVIKPHTPKQNGRVERSHRKDQERFYYKRVFYSLEDLFYYLQLDTLSFLSLNASEIIFSASSTVFVIGFIAYYALILLNSSQIYNIYSE